MYLFNQWGRAAIGSHFHSLYQTYSIRVGFYLDFFLDRKYSLMDYSFLFFLLFSSVDPQWILC